MSEVQGGVPLREYCATSWTIITNNDIDPATVDIAWGHCGEIWTELS